MPKYNLKVTRQMSYKEFTETVRSVPSPLKKAFFGVLFLSGCRVSEALSLHRTDISVIYDTIYIQFFRLKGSKQTDPQEIPNLPLLAPILVREDLIFPWSRQYAWRITQRYFKLYPHFFRMNRITRTSEESGDLYVFDTFGITAGAIDHYRGKVSIKKVGLKLKKEVGL